MFFQKTNQTECIFQRCKKCNELILYDEQHVCAEIKIENNKTFFDVITPENKNIGIVQWNDKIKEYCFYPKNKKPLSQQCMNDIIIFISKIQSQKEWN